MDSLLAMAAIKIELKTPHENTLLMPSFLVLSAIK
jgi:hypothetical protein